MKYIYNGNDFLAGVPAKDLSEEEVIALGIDANMLIASGLYTLQEKKDNYSAESAKKGTVE